MTTINPLAILALLMLGQQALAADSTTWTEGKNYFLVLPAQPTSVAKGKVEVTEVFSYACTFCNQLQPTMRKLKKTLPANAVLTYVPAGFNPGEDWPMFQRAYLTAQNFGVAEKAHDAMFDAVWKTGELAIVDPITGHLKYPLPTLEDAARFYHRATGVSASDFVASANSMGVITQIEQADTMVMRYRIDGTPAIIVNGRYRISTKSAGGYDQLIALVKWLVAKESH